MEIVVRLSHSQASLTGESVTTEKMADIQEDDTTPLLDLRNICFMVCLIVHLDIVFQAFSDALFRLLPYN